MTTDDHVREILRDATQQLIDHGYAGRDMHLTAKGGRPTKTARDMAVFLARVRKKEELGSLKKADAWIQRHWAAHGVTQAKHVRDMVNKARDSLLRASFPILSFSGGLMVLVAQLLESDGTITGAAWLWREPMLEAVEGDASNFIAGFEPWIRPRPDLALNPVAAAWRGASN